MRFTIGIPSLAGIIFNIPALFQGIKWALDWKSRYDVAVSSSDAVTELLSSIPFWFYPVALVAGIILIWADSKRQTREITVSISPLVLALVLSAIAIGAWAYYFYDRAQGPIVWNFDEGGSPIAWSNTNGGPPYFSAFQIQGFNRSDDPVTATVAYIKSNLTVAEVPMMFASDIPIASGVIQPHARFTLVSEPGQWRNPPLGSADSSVIKREFGSFTFVFKSPQKNYEIRFEERDFDKIVARAARELMRPPQPTVVQRR
jgi:hypothetical protein